MNTKTSLSILLCTAFAIPFTACGGDGDRLEIDCQQVVMPSQHAIAALTGLDNLGQVYDARRRLVLEAQRVCKRPHAERVYLVRDTRADTLRIAVASRR